MPTGTSLPPRSEAALRLPAAEQRALGAYYTPDRTAALMAEWALRTSGDRILEPSMGDGVFLRALGEVSAKRLISSTEVFGVELSPDAFRSVLDEQLIEPGRAIQNDFLAVDPFPVDAAIGNPPFVRLRHLTDQQRERGLAAAREALGDDMDPSGSTWMPFVLHATRFLKPGGRLAFVLPFDVTYVRYGRALWTFLGQAFGHLRIVRVHERVFDDLLQEVVLLFADKKGGTTRTIDFAAYERNSDLLADRPLSGASISIGDLEAGARPFIEALLPADLRELLHGKLQAATTPIKDLARVNIGYVTGHKEFFHPTPETVSECSIPDGSLRESVTSARQIRGAGVFTSGLPERDRSLLFLPQRGPLSQGEAGYVARGEDDAVDTRYKCRVRKPWWIVPYIKVPDVLLSVFSEDPVMLLNDGQLLASNSLLCGFMHNGRFAEKLVASWYTPLTALQRELQVHSLGGGVFVMVPNEVSRIRVPRFDGQVALADLDTAIRRLDVAGAYAWGAEVVLKQKLRLSGSELDLIEEGRRRLAHWRNSASAS